MSNDMTTFSIWEPPPSPRTTSEHVAQAFPQLCSCKHDCSRSYEDWDLVSFVSCNREVAEGRSVARAHSVLSSSRTTNPRRPISTTTKHKQSHPGSIQENEWQNKSASSAIDGPIEFLLTIPKVLQQLDLDSENNTTVLDLSKCCIPASRICIQFLSELQENLVVYCGELKETRIVANRL
jgi:hypothetical protein